jgi:hypothetical protein
MHALKTGHRSSNEQRPLRNVRLRIERHIRENAQDLPCAEWGFSWSMVGPRSRGGADRRHAMAIDL